MKRIRRRWRKLAIIPVIAILGALAAACSNVQTFASQCAYVIQNGYFDVHHVNAILLPGQRYNGNNVTTRFVYCNARNYIVDQRPNSDDRLAGGPGFVSAKTAPDPKTGDGTPVDVQLDAYFTLNEGRQAMLDFLSFCEKYNCFSPQDTTGNDNSARSSTQGWLNMIDENFPRAINRATQQAMLQFPTNIWNDTGQWPKVADAIEANFAAQMEISTQQTTPFFCGQGSHFDHGVFRCDPVKFSIETIQPSDPQIRSIYNQQVEQSQQQQLANQEAATNAALLGAAEKKYGNLAGYFLGLQDTINQCKGNANCSVIIGNPPTGVAVTPGK